MPETRNPSAEDTAIEAVRDSAETVADTMETASEEVVETMEAVAEETTEAIETIHDRLIDTVTAGQQEAIETIESASSAMLDMLTRTRTEISDFVAERIRQDLETQQAFLRCRNLDDIRGVQVQYLRTALDQYGVEAAKLVRISGEAAVKSFERVRA